MDTFKAILIDPSTRQITMTDLADSNDDITRQLDCESYEAHIYPHSETVILVDENAKLKKTLPPAFHFSYSIKYIVPFFGRALVVSCSKDGNLTDVSVGIQDVAKRIEYFTPIQ